MFNNCILTNIDHEYSTIKPCRTGDNSKYRKGALHRIHVTVRSVNSVISSAILIKMKITKVQNTQHNRCSAVVEKNFLVAEYRTVSGRVPRIYLLLLIIRHMRTTN